jgi:hypothetical protein
MKRSILTSLTVLVLAVGLFGGSASAHVLKTDGSIGAVLHIEPDDNPTTGKPTEYILSFSDDNGTLDISKCNCMVNVQENGKTISSRPIQVTDPTDSIDKYTFQKPDVYTLQFTGTPTTAGLFQPFTLNYLVRVTGSGGANGAQPFPMLIWVGMGMGIGLILLAAYAMEIGYNNEQDNKRSRHA